MLVCIWNFLWACVALLIAFLLRSWREMHFWQSALINTAKCRSLKAWSDSNPPPGEKPRFADPLETTAALWFRAQTTAGRLWQRRLRGWMTCATVVLKRDRCWRMVSAGGSSQVAGVARQSSSVENVLLLCGFSAICSVAGDMFFPSWLFVPGLSPHRERRYGKWQVGVIPAAHTGLSWAINHTTGWYSLKTSPVGRIGPFSVPPLLPWVHIPPFRILLMAPGSILHETLIMGHWAGQSVSTVAGRAHLVDQSLSKPHGERFGPAGAALVRRTTTPIEDMRSHECQKQSNYTPDVFSGTLRWQQRIARGVSKNASHLQQLTWLANCCFVNDYSSFNDTWKRSLSQHAVGEMIWFHLLFSELLRLS